MTDSPAYFVAHDVSDLINAVPTLFGFQPEESLVAIATHGPRRRFGFRMRMDLPDADLAPEAAELVVRHLRNQRAEGAIVIALTERQDDALAVLDAIHGELDDCDDIELVVRARADGEQYWTDELDGDGVAVAYDRSPHHLSVVKAVAAGQQILPDRQALVDRFSAVTGERRRWFEHAAASMTDDVAVQIAHARPGQLGAIGMGVIGPILDRGLAQKPVSDGELLRVAVWASCTPVRDAVWARIDRENATGHLQVLTQVSQRVVAPYEPAVLSLAAFAAWLTGDGAQALIAVERALEADPCYSMARLILRTLENGISPTTWQRPTPARAG